MPETITTRGLLFDMDGVLISSIGSVRRCWRAWCRHYGVPDADNFEVPHGMRAIEIIRSVAPGIDAEEGLRTIENIEIADVADLRVLPGARELLESLPPDRWTIVTSATRRLMVERLRSADLPAPDRIVSADDVTRGKPDPEPYLCGAKLLGFAPEDCVVVEDATAGVDAGLASGARVLAVLGTHEPAELQRATWRVPSLAEVTATLAADRLQLRLGELA